MSAPSSFAAVRRPLRTWALLATLAFYPTYLVVVVVSRANGGSGWLQLLSLRPDAPWAIQVEWLAFVTEAVLACVAPILIARVWRRTLGRIGPILFFFGASLVVAIPEAARNAAVAWSAPQTSPHAASVLIIGVTDAAGWPYPLLALASLVWVVFLTVSPKARASLMALVHTARRPGGSEL